MPRSSSTNSTTIPQGGRGAKTTQLPKISVTTSDDQAQPSNNSSDSAHPSKAKQLQELLKTTENWVQHPDNDNDMIDVGRAQTDEAICDTKTALRLSHFTRMTTETLFDLADQNNRNAKPATQGADWKWLNSTDEWKQFGDLLPCAGGLPGKGNKTFEEGELRAFTQKKREFLGSVRYDRLSDLKPKELRLPTAIKSSFERAAWIAANNKVRAWAANAGGQILVLSGNGNLA